MQAKQLFLTGFFLHISLLLCAQKIETFNLSGYIKDSFGKPIAGATISIQELDLGTTSDVDGSYQFLKLKQAHFNVRVSSVGFHSDTRKINLATNTNTFLDFQLRRDEKSLDEVSVVGKTLNQRKVQEIKQSGYAVNVIDLNTQVDKVADLNQLLRRSPGVTIREDGGMGSDFSFKINGLDAKIFIDAVPMENYGSSMTLNNIPVNLVDRIEVYKGVVPAYLPTDVLGGAVNIITKRRNKQFFDFSYGYGSFNTHQASLIANMRDAKTGLMVKADAFFNHSDNNYMMYSNPKYGINLDGYFKSFVDEETGIVQNQLVKVDKARRFHDAYTSGMGKIEAGFEHVKWADRLLFGLGYSENNKQIQMGSNIKSVYGGRWSENKFLTPSIQYRKNGLFLPDLYVDIFASYGDSRTDVRDTAKYIYYWSGIPQSNGTFKDEAYDQIVNKSYIAKTDFSYNLNKQKSQVINLSYNLSTNQQKNFDLMKTEEYREINSRPKRLNKHLINLAWQGQWLDEKLSSVVFFKYYGMDNSYTADERKYDSEGNLIEGDVVKYDNYKDYKSGGLTLRYLLKKDIGIKTSIEKSYKLPSVEQLYGNVVYVLPNIDLKPEEANNVNLGVFYNGYFQDKHFINLDVTTFLRNTNNYIQMVSAGNYYRYSNLDGARLYGIEFDAKYGYKDLFRVNVNGSYDKAIVTKLQTDESIDPAASILHKQLPNRPYLYGNVDISIGKNDWLGMGTRIELTYMNQYTHKFYMSWENLASQSTKLYIPNQDVHSAILSYSWKHNKYGVSMEARNFTDERLYDNFGLQKAGRAFYTKLRMSIF